MPEFREQIHPLVRRLAVVVCGVALLPIAMGALVTTLKAGMAFADWPSSDGQNMLLYPWLKDLSNPDKFTEHGHRLAGVLIGLVSMALVVVTWRVEPRPWVRRFSAVILAAVIGQGLLGGARVLLDRQVLAMLHSVTAAMFFSLCLIFLLTTGRTWQRLAAERDSRIGPGGLAIVLAFPIVVLGQYLLGGAFRHLHTMLDEHIAGAVLVTIVGAAAVVTLGRSESRTLRRSAGLIATALLIQLVLGLCAYFTRLGLPSLGFVATSESTSQVIACSLHTVGGIVLLGSAVTALAATVRLWRSGGLIKVNQLVDVPVKGSSPGGAA